MIPLHMRLERSETLADEDVVTRSLFEGAPADLPVAVLVEDGELLTLDRLESLGLDVDEAFEQAIEERTSVTWTARTIPVKGAGALTLLVADEAEDLLVPDALRAAAAQLGARTLALAIPARGSLLVMDGDAKWQWVAAFSTAARVQHAQAGDQALTAAVLHGVDGIVTGVITLTTASLDDAAAKLQRT
jgi:VCBS repeat-containing protein